MNLKKIVLSLFVFIFASFCFMLSGFSFFKKNEAIKSNVTIQSNSQDIQDNLWCVTFQLVWNELSEKFVKGSVNFVGGNPPIVEELNKKLYTSEILSENSYYTTFGKISKKLKKQIEKEIKRKFSEKSDILDLINWNAPDSYLFYSILKKDFSFLSAFDRLTSAEFNNSVEKVKYFGIKESTKKNVRDNITVLFYNSPEEYAVKLNTKEKEDVILYRTNKNDTFVNHFDFVMKNAKIDRFKEKDILIVPDISVNKTISYDELCGKRIEGTSYMISQALQTIQFKLDNKGGSLKSEAAIAIMKTALMPEFESPRYFLFDKPFVLFLMEQGKEKPYYAMKVDTTEYLVKE